MEKASFKEIFFGLLSGLLISSLGILTLGQVLLFLKIFSRWGVIAGLVFFLIFGGGIAGYFSRRMGWFFGGITAAPLTLLMISLSVLFLSPFWGFTPLAAFGMDVSFSPLSAGRNILLFSTIPLVLSALGGFLGEKLYWKFHK